MAHVVITAGSYRFEARFEEEHAPRTCAVLRQLLPLQSHVVHARWCGEAVWVPMGEMHLDLSPENATSYPNPGHILLYPGGISETEILIPYGANHFASKAGSLAGNHVLTVVTGAEQLRPLGEHTLWHGAQSIRIELASS